MDVQDEQDIQGIRIPIYILPILYILYIHVKFSLSPIRPPTFAWPVLACGLDVSETAG